MADALEPANFAAGTEIIKQGEEGNDFFIVLEGECVVTQTNESGATGEVGRLTTVYYFHGVEFFP